MSFSVSSLSSIVYQALYDAYHIHDILLLSSTGSVGSPASYPQPYPFVMGVGAVNYASGNVGRDDHQEVSGLDGGLTTAAVCAGPGQFCTPGGWVVSGGTSSATAIVAGIAGLVRSYNPLMSAFDVRQRMIATAIGAHSVVDAAAAVLGPPAPPPPPLGASIQGPTSLPSKASYTWAVMPEGGTGIYSYEWSVHYFDGGVTSPLGNGQTVSLIVGPWDEFELRVVVHSGSQVTTATLRVNTPFEL